MGDDRGSETGTSADEVAEGTPDAVVRRGIRCLRAGQAVELPPILQSSRLLDAAPELCTELVAEAFRCFLRAPTALAQQVADELIDVLSSRGRQVVIPVESLASTFCERALDGAVDDVSAQRLESLEMQLAWVITRAVDAEARLVDCLRNPSTHSRMAILRVRVEAARRLVEPPSRLSGVSADALQLPGTLGTTRGSPSHQGARAVESLSDSALECTVWYATNRRALDPNDGSKGYANTRGRTLSLGRCSVVVPRVRAFGTLGSSAWTRWIKRVDDRIRLKEVRPLAIDRQLQEMQSALNDARAELGSHDVLVYVHGYCTTFEQAAQRAAQLHVDLGVPGVTAFFSWPSRARLWGYFADEASIDASECHFADFIETLAHRLDAERIHILAHSMGNRGLARALEHLTHRSVAGASIRLGQVFLASPDVDVDLFARVASVYPTLAGRTTLYVSRRDRAVWLSLLLHMFPRVGFSPPVTVVEGVDTVEVSAVDFSLLGHGSYAEAEALLYDIGGLLRNDAGPARRLRLRPVANQNGLRYWTFAR